MSEKELKPKKQMSRWLRFTREIVAVAFWVFLLVKVIVFDIDVYLIDRYAPSLTWILDCKFIISMVLIAGLWMLLGRERFRILVAYVLFYPFIVLFWKIPKLAFRRWPLAIAFAPALYDVAVGFRFSFILLALAMVSGLLIAVSSRRAFLLASMVVLGFFLVVHLVQSFRKAYKSNVFSGLSELVKKLCTRVQSGSVGRVLWNEKEVEVEAEREDVEAVLPAEPLSGYYLFNCLFVFVADKLHEVARTRKADVYLIVCWLYTVATVVLVYAFEYWGLYKLAPAAFSGGDSIGFGGFLGFSFSSFTSSNISPIVPSSQAAQLLCYTEVGCTILAVMILFFTILTAARKRYEEDIALFISELRRAAGVVEERVTTLYRTTWAEAEVALLEFDPRLVNWSRKTRGLPELPVPGNRQEEDAPAEENDKK